MTGLFLSIVNMSIAAGWLMLAVLVLRLLLRRAPKWIAVLLWGLVAVRLVCPFTIESALSLIPSAETVSPTIMMEREPQIDTGVPIINNAVNPILSGTVTPPTEDEDDAIYEDTENTEDTEVVNHTLETWISALAMVWIGGMLLLLVYTAVSYGRLHRRVSTAVLLRDNIYQSERVASPFVLGIIRPRIYLPFGMNERDTAQVIAHEEAHICRRDHWWKPLGFLLLTVYWFNPLMWLGYVLLCRDIELACDEKVVRVMDTAQKADYSQALLTCSVGRRTIAVCPLAFGEVGVKDRVKSVLSYKKPTLWVILLSVVAIVVSSVCFLTDPVPPTPQERLLAVLDSEEKFVSPRGQKVYFEDYLCGGMYATAAQWYAFFDCNGDDVEEMAVRATPLSSNYMVFSIYDGDVYGYECYYDLATLKQDGTFDRNRVDFVGLYFEKNRLYEKELAYSSAQIGLYRVDGVEVTSARFERYASTHLNKPPVTWISCDSHFTTATVEKYRAFLDGSESAIDADGNMLMVNAYMYDEELGDDYRYAYIDMTGDGVPELCIDKRMEKYFFTLRDGEMYHWHTVTATYTTLLNNGALLYERHGGGPEHINYEYYELTADAQKRNLVEFSQWDAAMVNGEYHPAFYEINGKRVSARTYVRRTKKYLEIGDDQILWYDRYGLLVSGETAATETRAPLRTVLASGSPFVTIDGEQHLLSEYVTADGNVFNPQQYTYIDFDSDGIEEMVVYGPEFGNPTYGAYMVFHDAGTAVWGFEMRSIELQNLKEDGTFLHMTDDGATLYTGLYFNNQGMQFDERAYIDDIHKVYRIQGVDSTQRYVQDYMKTFYQKPDATWIGRAPSSNVATGEFYGGKASVTYTVLDLPYPTDLRYIPTVNGYAHFFDYSKDAAGDKWNAIDKEGRPVFTVPYQKLSYFSADGVAAAQKQNGDYVTVTAAGEETPITEEEFERLYKQWYPAATPVYPSNRPADAVESSSVYNGALSLYVVPSTDDTYLVGLADSLGNVVVPAYICVSFNEFVETLDLDEGVAYVQDAITGRMGRITVTITP